MTSLFITAALCLAVLALLVAVDARSKAAKHERLINGLIRDTKALDIIVCDTTNEHNLFAKTDRLAVAARNAAQDLRQQKAAIEELAKTLNKHKHHYEFQDGVLYIKEAILPQKKG